MSKDKLAEITPRLFIGSWEAAVDMLNRNIGHTIYVNLSGYNITPNNITPNNIISNNTNINNPTKGIIKNILPLPDPMSISGESNTYLGDEISHSFDLEKRDIDNNPHQIRILNIHHFVDTLAYGEYATWVKYTLFRILADICAFENKIQKQYNIKPNVVVNCAAGINRSATLCAMYLMNNGTPRETAIKAIEEANRRRNKLALTNHSFRKILSELSAVEN